MECINHPGTVAAGTCQLCGKALCASCMNRFSPPLCEPCLLRHNAGIARRLYFDLGITAVIFLATVIGIVVTEATYARASIQTSIFIGIVLACAYWGWQFLSRFSVPILFTSGYGLIIYLMVKFILSICFEIIFTPWQIFRRIKEINSINILKIQMTTGNV